MMQRIYDANELCKERLISRELIFIQDSKGDDGRVISRIHVKISQGTRVETYMVHVLGEQLFSGEIAKAMALEKFLGLVYKEEVTPEVAPVKEDPAQVVLPLEVVKKEKTTKKKEVAKPLELVADLPPAIPVEVQAQEEARVIPPVIAKKEKYTVYSKETTTPMVSLMTSTFGAKWREPQYKAQVSELSQSYYGKDYLDSNGEIIESFRVPFLKAVGEILV
jgi:hypothetical protein